MIDEFVIYFSLALVAGLIVFLIVHAIRRRRTTIRHPQPVRVIFKDPFGLALGFRYTLNPNERRRESFGNMEFVTNTGRETPPEHRAFELEAAKQGDTLSVVWILKDGSEVAGTTGLPPSASVVTVSLEKARTVRFDGGAALRPDSVWTTSGTNLTPANVWKFTLAFAIVGVVLLMLAAAWAISTSRFLKKAAFADGVVARMELERSGRAGQTLSAPVVSFKDQLGQKQTFTGPGSKPAGFKAGQRVRVAYTVNDELDARIVSFRTLWLFPTILGSFGIVFALFGMFATWHVRRFYSAEWKKL